MDMSDVSLCDLDDDILEFIQDHAQARFLFDSYVSTRGKIREFYRELAILMAQEMRSR